MVHVLDATSDDDLVGSRRDERGRHLDRCL